MSMDSAQHQKIVEAINKKIGDRTLVCPISGHADSWEVSVTNAALPAVDDVRAIAFPGGPAFPVAVVICQGCGYTFFMNLITLGLADELEIPVPANE